MAVNLPDCPPSLKSIQHYLKAAQEHDARDVVVSYWCRFYAVQLGLKIKTNQPDETKLFIAIMEWLEVQKRDHAENEAILNETVAQAHIENYAYKLFDFADAQDRASNYGKNVVKAFYTAGLMFDVLETFGDNQLSEENQHKRKYCKWKAAYIHNCLKNGETPVPGPMKSEEEDELAGLTGGDVAPPPQNDSQPPTPSASIGFSNPNFDTNPSPTSSIPSIGDVVAKMPTPPAEPEKSPGGFKAYVPDASTNFQAGGIDLAGSVHISAEQIVKAQKYCKYAGSALNYDDVKTAIDNLQKALTLLTTGQE